MQNAQIPFLFLIFNFSFHSPLICFPNPPLECNISSNQDFFRPVSDRSYTWGISSHFSALSMASLAFFLAFLGFQSSQSGHRPGERENKKQSKRDNSTTPIVTTLSICTGLPVSEVFEWCMHSLRISLTTSILEHYIHSRDQKVYKSNIMHCL